MNLGGPVWHASAAPYPVRTKVDQEYIRQRALVALDGVGDKSLGEWEESNPPYHHIRRRLTEEEVKLVGPVVDIRGTSEVQTRLAPVRHIIGWGFNE